jgi:uncharacterized CHY-type Zn-finger protein
MMYIEDILYKLNSIRYSVNIKMSIRDANVIRGLNYICQKNVGLTLKQRSLAVKILKKYHKDISIVLGQDISALIEFPQYKLAEKKPITCKTITIGNHLGKKTIIVKFSYDNDVVAILHKHKQKYYTMFGGNIIWFNYESKYWVFEINEINLRLIPQLQNLGFDIDPVLNPFLDQINRIIENKKDHIPYLSVDKDRYHIINAPKGVPPIVSNNLLDSLIYSRKYGINDWDETIQNQIDSDPKIKRFEKFFQNTSLGIVKDPGTLKDWQPMLTHCQKVLFVIPGGFEMTYICHIHEVLLSSGYKSDEVSVMFRTHNKSDLKFNEYVSDNNFNNPICDQIRAVLISRTLPKPLIVEDFNFDLIICGGCQYGNHQLKSYLSQQHNAIQIDTIG